MYVGYAKNRKARAVRGWVQDVHARSAKNFLADDHSKDYGYRQHPERKVNPA